MTAALGQQSVRGKRIEKGLRGRSLSHFQPYDLSPEAKGFVKSNYRDGLTPTEFFFHAMGGREGLVDTAVRTQQSGYMQRRLVNAMEHLRVEYDLTVRDPNGNIIQFLYGEDGIDPAKSDHGRPVNLDRVISAEGLIERAPVGNWERRRPKACSRSTRTSSTSASSRSCSRDSRRATSPRRARGTCSTRSWSPSTTRPSSPERPLA